MEKPQSPFVAGLKVGVRAAPRFGEVGDKWVERTVAKVYKNGNFTIEGSDRQQYKPTDWAKNGEPPRWKARQTGDSTWGFRGDEVLVWDDNAEEIRRDNAEYERHRMFRSVKSFWYEAKYENVDIPLVEQSAIALNHYRKRQKLKAKK